MLLFLVLRPFCFFVCFLFDRLFDRLLCDFLLFILPPDSSFIFLLAGSSSSKLWFSPSLKLKMGPCFSLKLWSSPSLNLNGDDGVDGVDEYGIGDAVRDEVSDAGDSGVRDDMSDNGVLGIKSSFNTSSFFNTSSSL